MNQSLTNPVEVSLISVSGISKKLNLIEQLLDTFHEREIIYCHWKSNEHLGASMSGDTDLDILFDEKDIRSLEQELKHLGFKKFNSITQKQYRDIEDYIGLDFTSGKVIHLHAHFRLTLGEPYLKSYQLNFQNKILSCRVYNHQFGIYCIQPAFELILLYFREALKLRNRNIIRMYLFNKIDCSPNSVREYNWLKVRCSELEIEQILQSIVVPYGEIYYLVKGKFDLKTLLKLSWLLKDKFKEQRFLSPIAALTSRWYREISVKLYRKSALLWARPIITRRINPRGGLVISVIGADGSGKSTIISNLNSTFKTKLDVYKVYMGRGNGNMSKARKILISLKKVFNQKDASNKVTHHHKSKQHTGLVANVYKCLEALIVAYEKNKNLCRIRIAKRKGMLVICDRFPQNQIMGYNDGPLLNYLSHSGNPIFRAASKLEAIIYARAESNPPDLLIKLIADANIVEARKPNELSICRLNEKIDGIKRLKMHGRCKVIVVDAAQPLKEVAYSVKKEIWNNIP